MDIQVELNIIVNKYGGYQKKELLSELIILFDEVIKSQHEIQKSPKTNISTYANCELIIENLLINRWYHISTVPDKLWVTFFNIADIRHEIIFDNERGDQYFKIVKNGTDNK